MLMFQSLLFSVFCVWVISSVYFSHRFNLGIYFILAISIIVGLSKNLEHMFLIILFLTLLGGILMLLMFLSSYTSDAKLGQPPAFSGFVLAGFMISTLCIDLLGLGELTPEEFFCLEGPMGIGLVILLSFLTLMMFVVFIWLS